MSSETEKAERQAVSRIRRLRRLIENGDGMAAVVIAQHPTGCAMSIQLVVEVDRGMAFSDLSEAGREALGEAFGKTVEEWLGLTDDLLFEGGPEMRVVQ